MGSADSYSDLVPTLALLGFAALIGVLGGSLVSAPVATFYRYYHRVLIGEQLETMPVDSRAAVLFPLAHARQHDTRRIAVLLMRELGVETAGRRSTEVAPSPAPEGRGDEASPAAGPGEGAFR
jgi:hypothetical protein